MEVWDVASDGSDARKLFDLTDSINLDGAHYSPDGRWIAFPDVVDGLQQVFVADAATGERRQLTFGPGDRFDLEWSPDGRSLAYGSSAEGGFQVWQLEVATGEETQLTFGPGRILHPSYAPSGQWMYVQPDHKNVYRLPRNGGDLTQVTFFPESGLYIDEPSVSPDGQWLLYTRSLVSSGLWLITLDEGEE
jgi:Tol biopolymer transport system component